MVARFSKSFKRLVSSLTEMEASLLWRQASPEKVYNGHAEKYRVAELIQGRIEEKFLPIIAKANQQGEKVRRVWVSCGKTACGVCRGEKPYHLYIEGVDKDIPLEQWLAKYVSPDEIVNIVSLIRNFEAIRILITYEKRVLESLGLLERS